MLNDASLIAVPVLGVLLARSNVCASRSGSAANETRVLAAPVRSEVALHFSQILQQHLVRFNLPPPDRFDGRIAGQEPWHEPPSGSSIRLPAKKVLQIPLIQSSPVALTRRRRLLGCWLAAGRESCLEQLRQWSAVRVRTYSICH